MTIDSTFVVMSAAAPDHGETAHVPLTLWDIANDRAAGGVILDYRADCVAPAPVQTLTARCLGVSGDNDTGPTVLLEWDPVLLDVESTPEEVTHYEIYRGDDAGHPEQLVDTIVIDQDLETPGYQWYDDVVVTGDILYSYRLKGIDATGAVSDFSPFVSLNGDECPGSAATDSDIFPGADGLRLVGRPNPFREGTTISFRLPEAGPVTLRVFDVTGRLVATLVDETLSAGRHDVSWDGATVHRGRAPGVYFARLEAGGAAVTRKLTLLE
jgi:hypothetical protein